MKVMVFGVFDRLHPGHLYLLYHARLKGKELVAVIARDASVKKLKGAMPEWSQRKRMSAVKATGLVTKVILGDLKEGTYAVVKKHKPDIICLGYDQSRLKKDLEQKMAKGSGSNRLPKIPLYTLKPYKAEVFHTSIRHKRK
jgi:cytidyltransferase-like protein